jgi:hypothetical protein
MPDEKITRPSGGDFPWLAELPGTPHEGDGNDWFDGPCLLYCRGAIRRVVFAGTIHVPGVKVSAQICETCARELQRVVIDVKLREDILRIRRPPPGL